MTAWEQWCIGVIAGVGEPLNAVSVDTHWAWSNAETFPYDLMRWNNPQNTTEPWPRARDSGAQPGAHDVKIYATIQDGIDATVYTLLNEPYYGAIVANLRAGLPRQQWGAYSTAGAELHAWGTGTNWLQATYSAMPDSIIPTKETEMDFFPRKASTGAIAWDGSSGKRELTASEWSHLSAGGAKYTDLSDADYDAIPNIASGVTTTPTEPAEPKTITLHVPAQDIKGDIA